MDGQGRVMLAERLARAEGELRAAQRALDGCPEARMRYAQAKAEHEAATRDAEEVLLTTVTGIPGALAYSERDAAGSYGSLQLEGDSL
jgi:hypothetical protein